MFCLDFFNTYISFKVKHNNFIIDGRLLLTVFVFFCLWDEAAHLWPPHAGLLKAFRELFATSPQLGFCPHGYKTVSRIIQRLLHLTLLRVH